LDPPVVEVPWVEMVVVAPSHRGAGSSLAIFFGDGASPLHTGALVLLSYSVFVARRRVSIRRLTVDVLTR